MNLEPLIDSINRSNEEPGDYVQNGLLYCGKCHTAKQKRGEGILSGKLLFVTCACKAEALEREKQEAEAKRIEELRKRCLPLENMRRHTFSTASDARHIQIARRYVEQWAEMRKNGSGLVFWGNTGSGKSYAAQSIANALIDKGISVEYVTAADLVSNLLDREISRREYKDKLCSAPLLIIDDIGAERSTDYAREQICNVIDARTESGKPLIATTNYALTELQSTNDQQLARIFDRLLGACVPVRVVGESRRKIENVSRLETARRLLAVD